MKKAKGIVIVLLSVMLAGCSKMNSEQQQDNAITTEQQTEENQSIQSMETVKENEPKSRYSLSTTRNNKSLL